MKTKKIFNYSIFKVNTNKLLFTSQFILNIIIYKIKNN